MGGRVAFYAYGNAVDPAPLVELLENVPQLTLFEWYADGVGDNAFRARIGAVASTRGAAETSVIEAAVAATRAGLPDLGPPQTPGQLDGRWSCEAFAFPSGSEAARWNTAIGLGE